MSDSFDETQRLRARIDELEAQLSQRLPAHDLGLAQRLVQTFQQTTYPTEPGKFFACHPVEVTGNEAEGQVASYTADTATIYVANLGQFTPPVGSRVLATHVPSRWVMRVD